MPPSSLSADDLAALRALAQQWGKIVARRAFGDAGPGLNVNFARMEEVARVAAQGLTEGTLAHLLEQQAQQLAAHQPCPDCATLCPVQHQPRPLVVRGGAVVQAREPVGHCPKCRRDFFPPAAAVAAGQPRLQPRRARKDRHRRRRAQVLRDGGPGAAGAGGGADQ